jgi:hypothetical protein
VNLLTEQLLGQQNGCAMLLLHAQFTEADEPDDAATPDWR